MGTQSLETHRKGEAVEEAKSSSFSGSNFLCMFTCTAMPTSVLRMLVRISPIRTRIGFAKTFEKAI